MSDDLVTIRSLATRLRHLGVSMRWIEQEAQAGRLPCTRIGQRFVYSVAAVEAALLERARWTSKDAGGGDQK